MIVASSRNNDPMTSALLVCVLGLLGVCCAAAQEDLYGRAQEGELLVEVRFKGDYLELEKLEARLELTVVRLDSPYLYLLIEESQLGALRKEGLQPRIVDADEFFTQLIRVEPATDDVLARVRQLGGGLVQREEAYAVFRVNHRQMKLLGEQEVAFRAIEEGELRPRFVEITVRTQDEMALVADSGVDIFEVKEDVVLGRAFDEQIEVLIRHGLEVEIVPPPQDGPF